MLSTIGRISAVVVVAGGGLLLSPQPGIAAMDRACDAAEFSYACEGTSGAGYHDGTQYWCPYIGACWVEEPSQTVSWDINFYENGGNACPPSLPC